MRPDYPDEARAHQGEPCIGKALPLHAVALITGPDRDKRRLGAHPGPWRGYQEPGFPRSSAFPRDSRRELKGLQGSGADPVLGFAGNPAGSCSSAVAWRSWRALDA